MVVRFEDVEFRRGETPPVLSHLTLTVDSGETVAIVGRSGVGKTTLLKLVNRLLLPASGRVLVDGRDTRDWDGIGLRRRIGYVFQDVGLFPHMSVEDNVSIVPRLEHWTPARARARALELLELVGLQPGTFARRRPHELSGGQRQRVGLARALAADPPVLLMDEPFGALDPVTRLEVRREFARIRAQLRTTVILVTHDMAEALALGSRVGVIDGGELVACDAPAAVAASADARVRALVETIAPPPAPRGAV
ncbi:MAG: ABC transporter ATP-binding protein [Acidobacteria bacterium RIFCSPLOWO2_12_FULL_67_14]|nr:MAG: ABC transporter ATP-binding protein [Acidobacteria bacterium RIFCSPLOWO2_12_FULL_67_14]